MGEHVVAQTEDLSEGDRVLTEIEGREIGVFCVDGEYYAFVNWCVHQGGPICEGKLTGQQEAEFDRESLETSLEWTGEDSVVACPWHGWEFDLESGENISQNDHQLPSYPVRVEDGDIIVSV